MNAKITPVEQITLDDTHAVAIGAGVLGTGGGGNTYIGRIWLEQELRERESVCQIVAAEDVPDDGYVCGIGGMGAPTVGIEKLPQGREMVNALQALEAHAQSPLAALVCSEIGGSNALRPLICGLQMGLPIIDGDSMGCAVPELQMDTFSIGGVAPSPMALADCHDNVVIFHQIDSPLRAEQYGRTLTIEMGGTAALAMPMMSGQTMKRTIIRDTYSLACYLGNVVLDARRRGDEPAEAVAAAGNGQVLFRGKITDVDRRTVQGFARGTLKCVSFGDPNDQMEIVFQNENLVAWHNGDIVCTVPDLICVLNLDDGEPLGTEMLRYGLRVAVLGMPAPKELKTPQALAVVGPQAFGYDVPFQPMPGDLLT